MAYSWIEPKTDWTPADKFTFTDYNRIRNNLLYINEKINTIYPDLYVELDLGEEKTDYTDEYFPSEFNAFEDALLSFERTGKNYNLGERYYHYDNSPFAWDDVLNRLEKCTLRWLQIDLPVTEIIVTPHSTAHTLMYIGDSTLFDVKVKPSNATHKNDWIITSNSSNFSFEKISNTQIRVTYIKGIDVKIFKHGNYSYDEQFRTLWYNEDISNNAFNAFNDIVNVKVDEVIGTGEFKFISQGSYTYKSSICPNEYGESFVSEYYKFTKIADNVDGRGITTFLMTQGDFWTTLLGATNRNDVDALWRKTVIGITNFSFSKNMLNALQSVTKEVMNGIDAKTNFSNKFHLPSYKEFGSESDKVLSLGSAYPYLASNNIYFDQTNDWHEDKAITRSIYRDDVASIGSRTFDRINCIFSSRISAISTTQPYDSEFVHPMIFLQSNLHVVNYHGHYKIDWSSESNLTLADIPLGSIVFDVDGNKDDLTQKKYVESITPSKSSITMNVGAIKTITLDITPLDALNINNLTVIQMGSKGGIQIDFQRNTITIKGVKKGQYSISAFVEEFPHERVSCTIEVIVNEKTDVEEIQLPYSIKNGGSSCARAREMHIAGGGGTFDGVSDHWVYDGDNWTQSTDLPYPMFAGGLYCRNDSSYIILVGGTITPIRFRDNCCDYSFSRERWDDYFDYPTSIAGIDSCIVSRDNYIYVLGSSTYIRTPSRGWSNRQNAIDIMYDGSAILYNNDIYFITSKTDYNSYLYKCTINSNHEITSYSRYCALPHNNDGGKLAVTQRDGQDVMYYLGGNSLDKRYFKLVNGNFTQVGELKYPFRYGTACTFNGSIYCIGGTDSHLADKMYKILTY